MTICLCMSVLPNNINMSSCFAFDVQTYIFTCFVYRIGAHFLATLPNCPQLDWYNQQIVTCWLVIRLNSNSRSIVLNPIHHSFKISYKLWWWCRIALFVPIAMLNHTPSSLPIFTAAFDPSPAFWRDCTCISPSLKDLSVAHVIFFFDWVKRLLKVNEVVANRSAFLLAFSAISLTTRIIYSCAG